VENKAKSIDLRKDVSEKECKNDIGGEEY